MQANRGHELQATLTAREVPPPLAPRRDGVLRVGLCIITRNRLRMLRELLDSFQAMSVPEDVEPFYVIVENNDVPTLDALVARFREAVAPIPVMVALEPDLGIPIARNRACDIAIEAGAELLAFVDDDETVTPDWLERIVARYRSTDLVLIGGPVLPAFPAEGVTFWQRRLQAGIAHRYLSKARKAEAAMRSGRQRQVSIITNNWLAEAAIFTRHGIRFDPRLRFTGGSDTAFWRDVHAAGLPTGWAPDAAVVETIPRERVSWRYQFRRAMEQSRTSLGHKIRRESYGAALLSAVPAMLARVVGLLVLTLALPFVGGPGLIQLARGTGWLAGRLTGLLGARSELYRETTGS